MPSIRSVSPAAARRRRCAARARRASGKKSVLPDLRRPATAALSEAEASAFTECILRAADQQVRKPDVVKAQPLAEVALGNVKLISSTAKRFVRVAAWPGEGLHNR